MKIQGGFLNTLDEKEKNRKKFESSGRGRRQDHGTRNNSDRRREWDTPEDKVLHAHRRDVRHGADEALEVETEVEE